MTKCWSRYRRRRPQWYYGQSLRICTWRSLSWTIRILRKHCTPSLLSRFKILWAWRSWTKSLIQRLPIVDDLVLRARSCTKDNEGVKGGQSLRVVKFLGVVPIIKCYHQKGHTSYILRDRRKIMVNHISLVDNLVKINYLRLVKQLM